MPRTLPNDGIPGGRAARRVIVGAAMALGLSGGAGRAAQAPSPVPTAPPPTFVQPDVTARPPSPAALTFRIVALGSSSTQGIGASSPAASYPAQLQRLFDGAVRSGPPISVINRGIGGEDIDDMTKRLVTDVLARKPNLVIWQVGSNDALRGIPLVRFEDELRDGIEAIRASGAEVVLMEPQWSPMITKADASSEFVDAVREIGTAEHVAVVRRFELMRQWMADGLATQKDLIGPDGLHMTDKGYTMLAQAVFDEISAHSVAFRNRMSLASTRHL